MQQYRQGQDADKTENQCRKSQTWDVDAVKEQRNTSSEVEMGLDHHHKESSLELSATRERVNQKPT